jgi:hypothetical protein
MAVAAVNCAVERHVVFAMHHCACRPGRIVSYGLRGLHIETSQVINGSLAKSIVALQQSTALNA